MVTAPVSGVERRTSWQVPTFDIRLWLGRRHDWCIIIPVINEGERIKTLLSRMSTLNIAERYDIIIVDGGSTDGSLATSALEVQGVRGLLVKTGHGKLSAQLRCGYAFALNLGYKGIITIDGNDKDDPAAIPHFVEALENGVDFVQASRFVPGGVEENTPWARRFAVRWIHAPMLSLCSGFGWTDTTQGFRGYSRRMLLDPRVNVFRDIFDEYELLFYLSYRCPRVGYVCKELPSKRSYAASGSVPTKISLFKGNFAILVTLMKVCAGSFNPR